MDLDKPKTKEQKYYEEALVGAKSELLEINALIRDMRQNPTPMREQALSSMLSEAQARIKDFNLKIKQFRKTLHESAESSEAAAREKEAVLRRLVSSLEGLKQQYSRAVHRMARVRSQSVVRRARQPPKKSPSLKLRRR